jgi:RNA polymerase sigma-70 factor (ECF subfamily)
MSVREPRPETSTSRSLIAGAQLADQAAWERLVGLYAPLVSAWCRRLRVAEQDHVDLVQDVFAAVARNLGRFQKSSERDTFRGWLATITRNKVHDYYRHRAIEPLAIGGTEAAQRVAAIPDAGADPSLADDEELLADAVFSDVLARALDGIRGEFHATTWQAFWGVVVDGRPASDVAAELHMKPGAVRVAKCRVLARLRHELGDT